MNLTFAELRKANLARVIYWHPLNEWCPSDWATAMAGECGEACNEIKKARRLFSKEQWTNLHANQIQYSSVHKKIADELADVIIYADLLAARLGINLDEAIVSKFDEVSKKQDIPIKLSHHGY